VEENLNNYSSLQSTESLLHWVIAGLLNSLCYLTAWSDTTDVAGGRDTSGLFGVLFFKINKGAIISFI